MNKVNEKEGEDASPACSCTDGEINRRRLATSNMNPARAQINRCQGQGVIFYGAVGLEVFSHVWWVSTLFCCYDCFFFNEEEIEMT